MKKLVLVALTALVATAASGCIITSGDDGPEEDAVITARWSIKNIATNDNNLPCPPGVTTAAVYAQAVDESNQPLSGVDPEIYLFNCDDYQGATVDPPLIPDLYQVWVELTSQGGSNVYARSLSAIVDVIDQDKTFETTILEDGGYFELDWTLRDANGGGVLSCASAQVPKVGVLVSVASSGAMNDMLLDCNAGYGVTSGMVMGTYEIQVSAASESGAALGDNVGKSSQVIGDQNAVTDLGHFDLPVD